MHCGKQIADEAVICLACGCTTKSTGHSVAPAQVLVEDSEPELATWSKICGIISFFIGWFALGITAIILANLSKEETGGQMCPSAKVGYICGIISTVLTGVLFLLLIVFLVQVL